MSLGVGSVFGVSVLGLLLLVVSAWLGRRDQMRLARIDEQMWNTTSHPWRPDAIAKAVENTPPTLETD